MTCNACNPSIVNIYTNVLLLQVVQIIQIKIQKDNACNWGIVGNARHGYHANSFNQACTSGQSTSVD